MYCLSRESHSGLDVLNRPFPENCKEHLLAQAPVCRTPLVAWLRSKDGVDSTSEACRPARYSTLQPFLLSLYTCQSAVLKYPVIVSLPE